jgi:hypothetical protein
MKRVKWTDTAEEDAFRVTFQGGMVYIALLEGRDMMSGSQYKAMLLDENNHVIQDTQADTIDRSPHGLLLQEIFQLARESALQPERVFDSVESQLRRQMQGMPVFEQVKDSPASGQARQE